MGTRERHDRERQAVREKILDAARELFLAEGFRHVSMRKIADRIEYSPAAIYSYFPSRDDIFVALFEEGFGLMEAAPGGPSAGMDPLEALRALFLGYYRFARQHPQYFELMFLDRTVPQFCEQWEKFEFMDARMREAVEVVQHAVDAGVLPPGTEPVAAFHVLWGAIHGPAAAAVCGRLGPGEDPDALARDVFEATLCGLRAGASITFLPFMPAPHAVHSSTAEDSHGSS
jgi:AcrR family transcriptional regulator